MATPRQPILIEPLKMAEAWVLEARDLVRVRQSKPELRLQEIQICLTALQLQELIAIRQAIRDQHRSTATQLVDMDLMLDLIHKAQRRTTNARKKSARR